MLRRGRTEQLQQVLDADVVVACAAGVGRCAGKEGGAGRRKVGGCAPSKSPRQITTKSCSEPLTYGASATARSAMPSSSAPHSAPKYGFASSL
jgi:hypothetical protein